jgi:RNA polymerase sigma factor (sigma-70 family)
MQRRLQLFRAKSVVAAYKWRRFAFGHFTSREANVAAVVQPLSNVVRDRTRRRRCNTLSDEELMEVLMADDACALDELFARHWSRLVDYAHSFLHGQDTAEDIAQETFVRLWRARRSWQPTGTVKGWLYRTARNLVVQQVRARRVQRRAVPELESRACAAPTPLEETIRSEVGLAFQDALNALPHRRKEAFGLVRVLRLSLKDSGDIMGISPQTVANHTCMAVADLRRLLAVHSPSRTL